jgi:hypothetical protein
MTADGNTKTLSLAKSINNACCSGLDAGDDRQQCIVA